MEEAEGDDRVCAMSEGGKDKAEGHDRAMSKCEGDECA